MTVRTCLAICVLALGCGGGTRASTTATSSGEPALDTNAPPSSTSAADEELTGIGIALDVTPPDATVTVDDVVMGAASELERVVALAPGLHTLVIASPGFKSYRAEFSVTDKVERFTVKLEPAP